MATFTAQQVENLITELLDIGDSDPAVQNDTLGETAAILHQTFEQLGRRGRGIAIRIGDSKFTLSIAHTKRLIPSKEG